MCGKTLQHIGQFFNGVTIFVRAHLLVQSVNTPDAQPEWRATAMVALATIHEANNSLGPILPHRPDAQRSGGSLQHSLGVRFIGLNTLTVSGKYALRLPLVNRRIGGS